MTIVFSLLFILLTCVIIWRASDNFESASEYLGRNLSEGVRGATINAIGSSMPELLTTIFFLFVLVDKDGFSGGIGTTAGSAVFNGVIIPALVILVVVGYGVAKGVKVSKKVVLRDGIALLLSEILLILFIGGDTLGWWQGFLLMLIYGVYMTYMLVSMRRNQRRDGFVFKGRDVEEEEEDMEGIGSVESGEGVDSVERGAGVGSLESGEGMRGVEKEADSKERERNKFLVALTLDFEPLMVPKEMKVLNAWILLLTSVTVIGGACFLLVDSCERLGEAMGIPIYFIAVVLASAATSVPDTIISMRDAMKGNYDDAVSNAIGSNIFDICFALGFPLFLFTLLNGPITMSPDTVEDVAVLRILLVAITLLAVLIFYFGQSMGRLKAIFLFSLYVFFLIFILGDKDVLDYNSPLSNFLHEIDLSLNSLRFWL